MGEDTPRSPDAGRPTDPAHEANASGTTHKANASSTTHESNASGTTHESTASGTTHESTASDTTHESNASDTTDTTVVLKLGGSLITRKDEPETLDEAALEAAASAIGAALAAGDVDRLVVVHGAGSFGHHHADRYGLTPTNGTHDAEAVCEVHAAMGRLDRAVLDALHDADVAAVPVRPLSAGHRDAAGSLEFAADQVATMLGESFVPVLHGDVIAHAGAGATIVSGDELVTLLADALGADRVGLCSTVPGVLDASGAVVDEIEAYDDVADVLGESESTDVTGGMAGKVRELLALDAPAAVFGAADLRAFLGGADVGTRVAGGD